MQSDDDAGSFLTAAAALTTRNPEVNPSLINRNNKRNAMEYRGH